MKYKFNAVMDEWCNLYNVAEGTGQWLQGLFNSDCKFDGLVNFVRNTKLNVHCKQWGFLNI